MKKILVSFAIMLAAGISAFAQDIITKKDGETIDAIISEVSSDAVKFKKFSNPNGPTYTIKVNEIAMITYENGDRDVFASQGTSPFIQPAQPESISPVQRNLKYSDLKKMYSTKQYYKSKDNPHSPLWCGVGSLLIPGLGQACCGEWTRALCFFVGNYACNRIIKSASDNGNDNLASDAALAQLVIDVWAIVDAVKVAKIYDVYFQDLKSFASIDVNLYPNLACVPTSNGLSAAPGLTLSISF